MDAGKLNKRVKAIRLTKSSDGFGGFTSSEAVAGTYWCHLKQNKGEIKQENGIREQRVEIELILRKKAANEILTTDVLQIEGQSEKHRIIDKFDSEIDFYTTIKAVRIQ
jgi:head-tail adaptor